MATPSCNWKAAGDAEMISTARSTAALNSFPGPRAAGRTSRPRRRVPPGPPRGNERLSRVSLTNFGVYVLRRTAGRLATDDLGRAAGKGGVQFDLGLVVFRIQGAKKKVGQLGAFLVCQSL